MCIISRKVREMSSHHYSKWKQFNCTAQNPENLFIGWFFGQDWQHNIYKLFLVWYAGDSQGCTDLNPVIDTEFFVYVTAWT